MEEFKDVPLTGPLGIAARVFRSFSLTISLAMGRFLGRVGYGLMAKKRALVYANLKTVFCQHKSPSEIRRLSRDVFINLTQSFVELMCIGNMKRAGFNRFVELRGQANIDQAIKQNKGVIFLAVHSGNWELGSVFNSLTGYTYNIVAHQQPKMPELGVLLNEARAMAGAHVIEPGVATKEIIKALKRNELVSLVLDQGGTDGALVNFFGKSTSMSSGAVRLALKYDIPLCPAWITRQPSGTHVLEFFPAIKLIRTGNLDQDIRENVQQGAAIYQRLLEGHPQEYLWFYKVFKYSTNKQVVILDDGNEEHLKKSQESLSEWTKQFNQEGKILQACVVRLNFQNQYKKLLLTPYLIFSRLLSCLREEDCLELFLTKDSYHQLMRIKADMVISCGEETQGINKLISQKHQAKSVVLQGDN